MDTSRNVIKKQNKNKRIKRKVIHPRVNIKYQRPFLFFKKKCIKNKNNYFKNF